MAAIMNKIIIHCLFVIAAIALSQYSFPAKHPSKKALLIKELQDIIHPYNAQIIINRQRIHKIAEQYLHDDEISESDFNWLKNIAESYQLTPKQRNDQAFFNDLLKRVDVIPNSLIISLAIVNGAWIHQTPSKRLDFLCLNPCSSESNTEQRLHLFFLSINTQSRYHQFREQRYQLRNQQQAITGRQLADSLLSSPTYLQQRHIIKKLLTTHKWQKMDNL
jgi:Bax protein